MNTRIGLCAACIHARVVQTRTGSRFQLCMRSRVDPRFARYPPLPVVRCVGFEATEGAGEEPAEGGR